MAEVIHEHDHATGDSSGGMGFFFGMIVLILAVLLIIFYGLPFMTRFSNRQPSVNVPGKIDVNINKGGGQ